VLAWYSDGRVRHPTHRLACGGTSAPHSRRASSSTACEQRGRKKKRGGSRRVELIYGRGGTRWAGGDFDADRGFGPDGVGRSAPAGWGQCLPACPCCLAPPPPPVLFLPVRFMPALLLSLYLCQKALLFSFNAGVSERILQRRAKETKGTGTFACSACTIPYKDGSGSGSGAHQVQLWVLQQYVQGQGRPESTSTGCVQVQVRARAPKEQVQGVRHGPMPAWALEDQLQGLRRHEQIDNRQYIAIDNSQQPIANSQ
jgi:hypothetical protein